MDAKDKYGQTPVSIALGDPEGLVYRQLPGGQYDYSFRQPKLQEGCGTASEFGRQALHRTVSGPLGPVTPSPD
jgi:hypothetical protein